MADVTRIPTGDHSYHNLFAARILACRLVGGVPLHQTEALPVDAVQLSGAATDVELGLYIRVKYDE